MGKFFIDRPVFAWVLAIFIMLAGILAITQLPISQYPSIAPPTIVVTAAYPGATAQTLDDSVTSLIEQEMNGADGLHWNWCYYIYIHECMLIRRIIEYWRNARQFPLCAIRIFQHGKMHQGKSA
jgi:hypothetical protein